MRWMATRTNQLIHIAEATGSKFYPRDSEAGSSGFGGGLGPVLETVPCSVLQVLHEKGPTKAMVGLQGLHSSDAFWWSEHVSASVGLKSFCPLVPQIQGKTLKTLVTHLQGGALQAGHSMWCLLIICWHVGAGGPGTLNQRAGWSHTRSQSWRSKNKLPKANSSECGWIVKYTWEFPSRTG